MKINWVWRLCIYGTVCILVGPFYDNWTSMEKYLYMAGTYSNMCPDYIQDGPHKDTWVCDAQQEKVSMLLTVARVAECSFSVVIGILMDRVGPKLIATVGVILRILGWSLIGFGVHINSLIIIGFLLIGMTVNFIVIPALTIGLYTKKYRFIAVIQVGMCSCFASLIIRIKVAILEAGVLSYVQINYLYTVLMLLPSLAISAIFFPLKLDKQEIEDDCNALYGCIGDTNEELPVTHNSSFSLVENPSTTHKEDSSSVELVPAKEPAEIMEIKIPTGKLVGGTETWSWSGLWRVLITKRAIICLLYFSFNFGSITFIQQTYSIMYRENSVLLTLNEYFLPLAFIPCIIFSVLYLYVQPIWILISINALGVIMHAIATVNGIAAGVLLSVTLVIVYSILNSKVYNYLDSVFDEVYMGSIVGALNTTCGIWLLAQGLLLQGKTAKGTMDNINYIMAALRLFFLVPFMYLAYEGKFSKASPGTTAGKSGGQQQHTQTSV